MAYGATLATVRSDRGTEFDLLARITARLGQASRNGPAAFRNLVEVLGENRRFWNRLAVDVAHPDNALPQPLRAQIFYLYEFVEHQSGKVLRDGADPASLIDINKAVMRGLQPMKGQSE
ncbi:MAG: flagellar biosynthesis regulator FlhF [Rhodobacterales bacterium]|nr:MAG: flagellar biosynthesis regulator FlhF [Rhodobacterales bacterium]